MPYKMAHVPLPVTSVPVTPPRTTQFSGKKSPMVCPLAKLGRISPAVEHSRYRRSSPIELKCRSPIDPSVYANLHRTTSPNSLEPSVHIHYFPTKRFEPLSHRNTSSPNPFKNSNPSVIETSFQNPPGPLNDSSLSETYYRSLPSMAGDNNLHSRNLHSIQNSSRQPLSIVETSNASHQKIINKTSSLPSDPLRNSYHDMPIYQHDLFSCLPALRRGSPTTDHSFIYTTVDPDSSYKLGRSSPSLDQGYHTLVSPSPGPSTPGPWADYNGLSPVTTSGKGKKISNSKSSSSFPCVIDRLPDSAMLKIFSWLDSTELCACARVCKRWENLVWEPKLWRVIKLSGENISGDKAVRCVLRRLCGQGATGSCSVVEKVFISDGAKITDKGLMHLARRCTELTHLQLQGCSAITNHAIFELATKCLNLQHLDLTGCSQISCLSVIPGPDPPPRLLLQYLDLTDCSALEDGGLKIIVCNCPQLVYLYLRRCVKITDIGIKFIPSFCSMLRELSVSDCNRVTDFGLHELAKLGAMLRYLSVAKCDRVSDAGLKVIARRCYKLRYLNARGCEAVSDDAITVLARSCPRLRALDIGKCDVSDAGLRELAQSCPNLKKLSLRNCDLVTDRGVQFIAYYCRGLQQLNIQDCQISIDGYRAVKKYCKRCVIEHTNPGFF